MEPTSKGDLPESQKMGIGNQVPQSLPLKELIVNNSLSEWSSNVTSFTFTKHCSGGHIYVLESPYSRRLQRKMSSLLSRCPNLSLARLISHSMPSLDWYAFDVISGNKLWIPAGASWDVEGKLCDDDDTDDIQAQRQICLTWIRNPLVHRDCRGQQPRGIDQIVGCARTSRTKYVCKFLWGLSGCFHSCCL